MILISQFVYLQEVAIVTKSNGTVKYKKNSATLFKNQVKSGLELFNNDLLVTGIDGFVMFAYLDDGSLIKIHKDSEVYVNGSLKNNIIDKKIIIDDGFLKFDIKKQKQNEFKVVTPTSVASVKGTVFYIDSNDGNDVFYGLEGLVEVLNIESNETSNLSKSKKIISTEDGSISIEEITQEDIIYIQQIQQESGIEIEEIEEYDIDDSGDLDEGETDTTQEVIISLTSPSGEVKKIIIKFNQQ